MIDKNNGKLKSYSFTNAKLKGSNLYEKRQKQQTKYEKSQKGEQKFDSDMFHVRFKRKDLKFQPGHYVTAQITIDDVIDLKEVFDTYDSTGLGVLLPNDLKLLLTQNDYEPDKKTLYETIAEFDTEEAGGLSFSEFMKVMDAKPYLNQTKRQIAGIFKKYDRSNKGYINLDDIREINRQIKENMDEQTLKLMLEKSDSNSDGKVSFEDFYSVMVKRNIY